MYVNALDFRFCFQYGFDLKFGKAKLFKQAGLYVSYLNNAISMQIN